VRTLKIIPIVLSIDRFPRAISCGRKVASDIDNWGLCDSETLNEPLYSSIIRAWRVNEMFQCFMNFLQFQKRI